MRNQNYQNRNNIHVSAHFFFFSINFVIPCKNDGIITIFSKCGIDARRYSAQCNDDLNDASVIFEKTRFRQERLKLKTTFIQDLLNRYKMSALFSSFWTARRQTIEQFPSKFHTSFDDVSSMSLPNTGTVAVLTSLRKREKFRNQLYEHEIFSFLLLQILPNS